MPDNPFVMAMLRQHGYFDPGVNPTGKGPGYGFGGVPMPNVPTMLAGLYPAGGNDAAKKPYAAAQAGGAAGNPAQRQAQRPDPRTGVVFPEQGYQAGFDGEFNYFPQGRGPEILGEGQQGGGTEDIGDGWTDQEKFDVMYAHHQGWLDPVEGQSWMDRYFKPIGRDDRTFSDITGDEKEMYLKAARAPQRNVEQANRGGGGVGIGDSARHSGGPVTADQDMSAGPEDVAGRLQEGEYVIPRAVVQMLGEDFFNRLLEMARGQTGDAPPSNAPMPSIPKNRPSVFEAAMRGHRAPGMEQF